MPVPIDNVESKTTIASNILGILSSIAGFFLGLFKVFATNSRVNRLEGQVNELSNTVEDNYHALCLKCERHTEIVKGEVYGVRELVDKLFNVLLKISGDLGEVKGWTDAQKNQNNENKDAPKKQPFFPEEP